MRLTEKLQLFLAPAKVTCDQSKELAEIDRILNELPDKKFVLEQILKDVTGRTASKTGRDGVSAEQILKLGLLRKRHSLTYRGLAQATGDSLSMRNFLNLPMDERLSKSAIQGNLKAVKDSTWELLQKQIAEYAKQKNIESGEAIRGDCTTVETNIHHPTDASLLNDVVRVLCRNMMRASEIIGAQVHYEDRSCRAKARLFKINNTHNEEKRRPQYLELIRVTRETIGFAKEMLPILATYTSGDLMTDLQIQLIESELKTYIPRGENVIDQAYRRIVLEERVPAADKIVSIFEEHTDIIVKGFRDAAFGHKVVLTTGRSALILDLQILDGNPKDSTLVPGLFERVKKKTGRTPIAAAFDGCFASTANRDLAKEAGVEELTFSKNGSMDLGSLVSSPKLHKALKNFRAGVEGCISFAKRIFGFSRVFDKSLETFKAALQLGAAAYNLTMLARINCAAQKAQYG